MYEGMSCGKIFAVYGFHTRTSCRNVLFNIPGVTDAYI